MRRVVPAFLVDVAFVLLFAMLGRISHVEGVTLAGVLETGWPFVAGLTVGWGAARALLRRWPAEVVDAFPIWVVTVAVGLLLRVVSGSGGAPWSFVLVATLTLGLFLLGWRSAVAVGAFAVGALQQLTDDLARRNARR